MRPIPRRAVLATGCAMGAAGLVAAPALAQGAQDVSLITDFGFNGRHAYFYVALEKGYYRAEGLNMTILRGQGSADAIRKTAAGSATMGFADAGALVLARANDAIPVKLSSIMYAAPPQAIFSLAEKGITTPKALEGKTVADTAFSSVRLLFNAYARAAGIDASKVTWVTAEGSALPSLLATGRVDAIGQFTVGAPLLEAVTAPKPLSRLAYRDAGMSFYGNGLVATEQTFAEKPELVRAITRATLKGMADAFANPAEAGAIMNRHQRQVTAAVAEGETRLVAELAQVPGRALGAIDPARIRETVEVMASGFTLRNPVAPADLFVPGFAG